MSRSIACNGSTVLKLRLLAPIAAAWIADAESSSDTNITGAAKITDGTNEWKGTIIRSGVVAGVCSMLVVGGSGGLRKGARAQSYTGAGARQIVTDILNEAGEKPAQKALTAPALRTVLQHWTRLGNTAMRPVTYGEQLAHVLEHVGATWRVLPDGTIWIGSPTFVAAKPAGLVEIIREPAHERVNVELDGLDLLPDTSLKGDRVGDVEYRVDANGIKATYWLEAA
jgi:hypothetical protein